MLTYRYKLYSSKRNRKIDAMLREACFVWNHALALQKRYYSLFDGYIGLNTMQKHFAKRISRCRLHSQTVQEILERLDASYQRFFLHSSTRPPKFKRAEQFRNPMLADKAKADLEKQLMELQQQLMKIEQSYRAEALRIRQELQEDEGRLLKATTDDLRKRITKFAKDNEYDIILDKNAAPYSVTSLDVTDNLLKDMGVDPKKARGRDESK